MRENRRNKEAGAVLAAMVLPCQHGTSSSNWPSLRARFSTDGNMLHHLLLRTSTVDIGSEFKTFLLSSISTKVLPVAGGVASTSAAAADVEK